MRFLVDENLPLEIVHLLKKNGHHAVHALDRLRPGGSDLAVFRLAQRERRILITCDLDFSDIRLFPPGRHAGILLLRVEPQSVANFCRVLDGFLRSSLVSHGARAITILDENGFRIRTAHTPE